MISAIIALTMSKKTAKKKGADKILDLDQETNKSSKKKGAKKTFKIVLLAGFGFLFFGTGVLATVLYYKFYLKNETQDNPQEMTYEEQQKEENFLYHPEEPIRAPLNGITLTDEEYEKLSENIPHAVLISNNKSARDEQYGLTYADVVYEAETEGGITRFMALFWTNQEGYIMKPVRSIRKYFFDWTVEYGNIPVTFSGFAATTNYDTNSWGFYKEYNIRVTYFDWPLKWDDACLAKHPSMHCKRTTPELLYDVFDSHEWTYEGWKNSFDRTAWRFSDEAITSEDYEDVEEFAYDFSWALDWGSKWIYKKLRNVYHKYEPDELHVDMDNQNAISASTVIIQKAERTYTRDAEHRVTYKTVGQGDAYILRDGKRIDAIWEKTCYGCRTLFYEKLQEDERGDKVAFKPGLIWIAMVPTDKEVRWGS